MVEGLELLFIEREDKFMVRYRDNNTYTIEWFDDVGAARQRMFILGGEHVLNTVIKQVKRYDE